MTDNVRDKFRPRSIGNGGTAPFNSKPGFDNFHVDQSRLGVHEEYDPTVPNDWGGMGKYVDKPNDVRLNAVGAMGDILARSSYKNPDTPTNDTGSGPCCVPRLYPSDMKNPMYKKRGGE